LTTSIRRSIDEIVVSKKCGGSMKDIWWDKSQHRHPCLKLSNASDHPNLMQ